MRISNRLLIPLGVLYLCWHTLDCVADPPELDAQRGIVRSYENALAKRDVNAMKQCLAPSEGVLSAFAEAVIKWQVAARSLILAAQIKFNASEGDLFEISSRLGDKAIQDTIAALQDAKVETSGNVAIVRIVSKTNPAVNIDFVIELDSTSTWKMSISKMSLLDPATQDDLLKRQIKGNLDAAAMDERLADKLASGEFKTLTELLREFNAENDKIQAEVSGLTPPPADATPVAATRPVPKASKDSPNIMVLR